MAQILVVDDSSTNRQILQVFLKRLGCQVVMAEDGQQGLDRFLAESPDLVFMDVMMPVMDGYEATRRIKAASADRWVPVIFLSALDKDQNVVVGLEAGGTPGPDVAVPAPPAGREAPAFSNSFLPSVSHHPSHCSSVV